MKKFFTFLLLSAIFFSAKSQVVISQLYGGGGNSGSTYTHDFIEIFNRGASPISLNGWSVQYASATGTSWQVTNLTNFTLQPGQYYLIQEAQGAGGTTPLPTPDATGTIAMSGTAGKVALVNTTTALTGSCPTGAMIIDFVGFGTTANCFEGAGATAAPSNTNAVLRAGNGCTDNNNNAADFAVGPPTPRNTASPVNLCSGPIPTLTISSPLAPFGNVCINTTAGPNSFTISGSNLTTANITVAALTGFTYSTTSGGTYTASLNLTQPGGSYSQQIFVKFDPTAVQSYNGNIVVAGGGATSVNAAASGAGVNTMPSVTTGAATSITQTTATAAGTITATGCTAISAYGIEYSTTAGFPPGTGLQVASSNLSGGNFSSGLTGLSASTTYYYRAYATNGGGTAYGAEQSFVTASPNPTINTTALTAFGNVCINTTAGPNSFTISGANLTTANVTVGALAGFTYSTTAGGTYTATLSLAQPGGTYTQQIFVRFTPTAVQSYNGNIPVGGGGVAAPVNVAASGAGVNAAPTVTTGAASAITQTTATAAGTISSTGCSAVSAYGIEYSLINGFANGTGTPVASSNLAGGNFTAALSGLVPSTTYYYKAYATNAGGTAYGAQQSFTTASPVLSATALSAFGTACISTTAGPNSFTITGVGLTNVNVVVGPLSGYTFSTTSGGTYTASLNLTQGGGAYTQTVYVLFTPVLVQSYNGNIPVSGGGAAAINVAAVGSGVNTLATVITGAASDLTNHSAVLAGSIASTGCSNVTEAGIEFSGITGFANGTGTKVLSTNLTGGNFSSSLSGLVQGATYYYKAYAVNNGGTSYGLQQSFTVPAIANEFTLYPVPVNRGAGMRVTMNNLAPGNYSLLFFSSDGKLAYQHNLNIQAGFINQVITIPYSLPMGVYRVQLADHLTLLATKSIIIE